MNTSASANNDSVELIIREEFEAFKIAMSPITSVHVTRDFFMRLKANVNFEAIASIKNIAVHGIDTLFGYPLIVHYEPCEKEYWFEDNDGKKIQP